MQQDLNVIFILIRGKNSFDVHHDPDNNNGYSLEDLCTVAIGKKELNASIWLDIKNLNDSNASMVLKSLIVLRDKYGLQQ